MGTRKPPAEPKGAAKPSLLDRRKREGGNSASLQGLGPRGPRGLGHALIAARLIDEDDEPAPYLTDLLGDLLELLGDDPTLPRPNSIHALRPLALEVHVRNAIEIFQRRYHLCPTGRFDRPTLMEMARKDIVDQPRFIKKPPSIPLPAGSNMRPAGKPMGSSAAPGTGGPAKKPAAPSVQPTTPAPGSVKRGLS